MNEVEKALYKLRKLRNIEENEFFSDFKNIDAAKYNFILAIEACIDICNHIVAKLAKRIPKDYADCFKILNEIGLIKDQEFVYRLMNIERFRNILVHFYWKVEDERLFKILKIENHKFIAFHEHRYALPQVLGKKRSPLPFS